MANRILVIDDASLMRPSLAVALERAAYRRRSSTAGAEEALTLNQVCPPEVIFLTARQARLDQVLGPELGADGNVSLPFDLGAWLAHVKAAVANQLAYAAARRRQVWVSAAFAVGVLLLVLAAPRWIGWAQTIATYEPPTADRVWNLLTHLMFDPATTFNTLLSQTVQTWLNPSGQMDMLTTLGIIVLAVTSVAGLAVAG
jgi:CheY-like chemotaxis protein